MENKPRTQIEQTVNWKGIILFDIVLSTTKRRIAQVIHQNPDNKSSEEYMQFRQKISEYYWKIIKDLCDRTTFRDFHHWYEGNIAMLQNIYRKFFPYYREVVAWHCLIWSTPRYEEIKYQDFPWDFAIMNFLVWFRTEIDKMSDK